MATTSRADKFTQTQKKQVLFSDFLDNFDRVPFNNQLAKVTNENSVRQSITNLVLTNYGERLFQPNVGGNVNDSLFEFADAITTLSATDLYSGQVVLTSIPGNIWIESGNITNNAGTRGYVSAGTITLSGALDRVNLTTVGGVDTFDAGSVLVLYE